MKRIIDHLLLEWKNKTFNRKPLLLRGARQVGKTHAARVLGKTFSNFIEINLEKNKPAHAIFEYDLDPIRIMNEISELTQQPIKAGSTLLFFDEIQAVPNAIIALRYFYESVPELHVIAAGSLVDFAIAQVGMPVGRITTLYMYPMSFMEFLVATNNAAWARTILAHDHTNPLSDPLHEKLLRLLGTYLAIGGMPEAVNAWIKTSLTHSVKEVHTELLFTYKQDFEKYSKKHQLTYLNLLFSNALDQLGNKFMFSKVGGYQKRELYPAMELLEKAGLFYPIFKSSAQGIPIGAQADINHFKIIFFDVGLSQALLNFDITSWILDLMPSFINKGQLVEAFVGQEILAYSEPIKKEQLYYWHKESRSSNAEVDYLVQIKEHVIPIKVKSGTSGRAVSMHIFLESHPQSPYGMRFWARQYGYENNMYSYPLYAIAKPLIETSDYMKNAVQWLIQDDK